MRNFKAIIIRILAIINIIGMVVTFLCYSKISDNMTIKDLFSNNNSLINIHQQNLSSSNLTFEVKMNNTYLYEILNYKNDKQEKNISKRNNNLRKLSTNFSNELMKIIITLNFIPIIFLIILFISSPLNNAQNDCDPDCSNDGDGNPLAILLGIILAFLLIVFFTRLVKAMGKNVSVVVGIIGLTFFRLIIIALCIVLLFDNLYKIKLYAILAISLILLIINILGITLPCSKENDNIQNNNSHLNNYQPPVIKKKKKQINNNIDNILTNNNNIDTPINIELDKNINKSNNNDPLSTSSDEEDYIDRKESNYPIAIDLPYKNEIYNKKNNYGAL